MRSKLVQHSIEVAALGARLIEPARAASRHKLLPLVRRDAVRSLGWLGPASRPVASQVARLRDDPDAKVKEAARQALARIGEGK